jgi:hypothetical protein
MLETDKSIFCKPDNLEASIEYNTVTLLEDDDWYSLSDFSHKPYCLEFLTREFVSVDYAVISPRDFSKIIFLWVYQDGNFFFQRVTPAKRVKRKWLFVSREQWEYEENGTSISLNDYPDAIYNLADNTLYFRKLCNISGIFAGIDELYREATKDEVRSFCNYDFIELAGGFTADDVKTNNRKRITKALDMLKHFSNSEMKKIFSYIKDYCPELATVNGKFSIHNEDSLKKLLYGIEQRYYTTLVGDERRLANSVIPMNQGTLN